MLGRFREGNGSRFQWVPRGGGSRFRWVPAGSGPQGRFRELVLVFDGRGLAKVPGSRDCIRQVWKVAVVLIGVSGFRWVPRFGKWLRFRRFWSSWFWWVLTVSKVPGPRAAEDMWDQVLAIFGLEQCGWQCCAESECICVKGIVKPPCCWGYHLRMFIILLSPWLGFYPLLNQNWNLNFETSHTDKFETASPSGVFSASKSCTPFPTIDHTSSKCPQHGFTSFHCAIFTWEALVTTDSPWELWNFAVQASMSGIGPGTPDLNQIRPPFQPLRSAKIVYKSLPSKCHHLKRKHIGNWELKHQRYLGTFLRVLECISVTIQVVETLRRKSCSQASTS